MNSPTPPGMFSPRPSSDSIESGQSSENGDDRILTIAVGLSDPNLSQSSRKLLDLVNRLHDTGVQSEIDLPQIAVIGSQSAGKSSLIESISGITLPRAAGTCTRCPTECRLSRSIHSWKCKVSIHKITNAAGERLSQTEVIPFGDEITEKRLLEERIRRAQRAILTPSKPIRDFLDRGEEEWGKIELSFSKNWVSLEISGPDVADLSFVDLPGLIASVGTGGNVDDIALVREMASAYIRKESCVILLTVTCETDFENQGAHNLAREHDPEGRRTVGVLTKPDRIPPSEESRWISLLRNITEPLENGWFCVKQPSSKDLDQGVTWEQARAAEDKFFSSTSPWSTLDAHGQRHLRTTNLVSTLSAQLSDLIRKRLPGIQREIAKKIEETLDHISDLGPAPSKDPVNEINNMIHTFQMQLTHCVEGDPNSDGLLQKIRPAQEEFRRIIRSTAPNFKPFEKRYKTERKLGQPEFLRNEDGIDDEEENAAEVNDQREDPRAGFFGGKPRYTPDPDAIYIDEVMDIARRARTRELPGAYPFFVQQQYIEKITKQWERPARQLCNNIYLTLLEYTTALVMRKFGSYGQGTLEQRVSLLLQRHVKKAKERADERISWLLQLERRPFTLNQHYLLDYKDKFTAFYKGSRVKDQHPALMESLGKKGTSSPSISPQPPYTGSRNGLGGDRDGPSALTRVLSGLTELGVTGTKAEDLPKLLPADEMAPALNIMADVRAYFQVAYKRYADTVPLALDYELVTGVERGFLETMCEGLGITGPKGAMICHDLAQESRQVADRRADLGSRLEILENASEELTQFGRGF